MDSEVRQIDQGIRAFKTAQNVAAKNVYAYRSNVVRFTLTQFDLNAGATPEAKFVKLGGANPNTLLCCPVVQYDIGYDKYVGSDHLIFSLPYYDGTDIGFRVADLAVVDPESTAHSTTVSMFVIANQKVNLYV